MAISMLKIRRPLGRLIFNMGIAIPGKTVFLIETAPSKIFKEDEHSLWIMILSLSWADKSCTEKVHYLCGKLEYRGILLPNEWMGSEG